MLQCFNLGYEKMYFDFNYALTTEGNTVNTSISTNKSFWGMFMLPPVASCCLSSKSCDFLGVTATVNHAIVFVKDHFLP